MFDSRLCQVLVFEKHGLPYPDISRFWNPDFVTPVVFLGVSQIISFFLYELLIDTQLHAEIKRQLIVDIDDVKR